MGNNNEEEKVILLDYWRSPYTMRAKIALEEKGIDYECREDDLGNKSSLLLEMNPIHKSLPLIHNGKPICESLVIVEYIDEVWSHHSPFFPNDPYLRSQVRFWGDFIDNKIFYCAKELWRTKGEEQKTLVNDFIEGLKLLEDELKEEKIFGGNTFGYIDVALVSLTSWFYALENCGNFSIALECPKLMSWAERCKERPSVSKSLPDPNKINDYDLALKKKFGLQ